MAHDIRYFVFDVESVADPDLVAKLRYPHEEIEPEEAVERYRHELIEKYDSDFIPYTYQVPVAIAIAKVTESYRLVDLVVLDEPHFRPHVMTELFWRGWEAYKRPTLVTFNGRAFDIPLLELAAFRYGISIPGWFQINARAMDQPRNRYNTQYHLDLCELLTNFGSTRFSGGLNLAAHLLGKPGKMEIAGHMVQDLYREGRLAEINEYCRCDVLDTYFIFLRSRVLVGQLTLEEEHQIVEETKAWLAEKAKTDRAARMYLEHWGDWRNPWQESSEIKQTAESP